MSLPFPTVEWGGDNLTVKGIQPALKPGGKILTVPASCFSAIGGPAASGTHGNATTVVTTTIYIVQAFVDCNCIATGVALLNGATAAGNTTVGIADSTGKVFAVSAATAMAGTASYQRIPFTAPQQLFGPGVYYILVQNSNATAIIQTYSVGSFSAQSATTSVLSTSFTFTPATTFTANVGPVASFY